MASFCNPGYFIGFNHTNAGKILTGDFQGGRIFYSWHALADKDYFISGTLSATRAEFMSFKR